jgi:hypothetical protein
MWDEIGTFVPWKLCSKEQQYACLGPECFDMIGEFVSGILTWYSDYTLGHSDKLLCIQVDAPDTHAVFGNYMDV